MEVQKEDTDLWYSAEYWTFKIGSELYSKYRLEVGGYSGDAGDAFQHADDFNGNGKFGYYYHNGMKFTTHDNDNDESAYNCASSHNGGWWFNSCHYACLMCGYEHHNWKSLPEVDTLVTSRMMIKPQ